MKRAVIYGSTGTGKHVYELAKNKYEILYFVDEDPKRIGEKAEGKEIRERDSIFRDKPDVILMGILTGYEEAVAYLISKGVEEEQIICGYVDLPSRARRDCLEKIAEIFREKGNVKGLLQSWEYIGEILQKSSMRYSRTESCTCLIPLRAFRRWISIMKWKTIF